MGLAALSGAFKRAGLDFEYDTETDSCGDRLVIIEMLWNGKCCNYVEAACDLFDIDSYTADRLFTPGNYGEEGGSTLHGAKGERKVAKRIRDLVSGKITV